MVLLSSPPSAAQQGGTTISGQGDQGCANPQPIETFTGTESQRTPTFNITGDTLRLSWETEATIPDATDENLAIRVLDESGSFVDSVLVLQPETGSDNIFVDPGTYRLELDAGQEVRYTVTVEDCVGTNQGDEVTTNQDDDEITVDNQPRRDRPRRGEVINIPDKPLPPTGGWPVYATVASFVLVGAGLLGLGIEISRRRPRR